MKIFTFIRHEKVSEIVPSISWWSGRCDINFYEECGKSSTVLFAEVDNSIYLSWCQYGRYYDKYRKHRGGLPTTGCYAHNISITASDNKEYLSNKEIVQITTYNQLVIECMKRGIPVSNISYVSEEMLGWSR